MKRGSRRFRVPSIHAALRITSLYFLIGSVWIIGSDLLVATSQGGKVSIDAFGIQTVKGLFFVAVTALLLYLITRRTLSDLDHSARQLKETNDRLRESEARYRAVVEDQLDFIVRWRMDGTRTFVNDAYCRTFGISAQELVGTSFLEQVCPEDRDAVQAKIERMARTGASETDEHRALLPDGTVHWHQWMDRPLTDDRGVVVEFQSVGRDVTERRMAEEALRASEARYRTLVETMNEGIVIFDAEARATYANQRFQDMLNFTLDEFVGQSLFELVPEESRAEVVRQWERRRRGEAPPYELVWWSRDGRRIPALVSPCVLRDEHGDFAGSFSVVTDLTQVKQLEERVARAEKMESLGRLAGGVAHDLNNVLTGLVSYPDLLLSEIDEDSSLREPLTVIKKSGQRAAGIVEDLLTLARRGVAPKAVVSVNDIVREFLDSPEFRATQRENNGVKVSLDLSEAAFCVQGNALHLSKLVMNLVNNAFEACQGVGTVAIHSTNAYLESTGRENGELEEGEYVVLTVTDTGTGMPEEDVRHIFEPFYTKKVMGRSGTGLGLTVVWGVVRDHRGAIAVKSSLGRGTTFTIHLPATREAVADGPVPGVEELRGNGEAVLVVDDVEEQRNIACQMLASLGYRAAAVATGGEAQVYAAKCRPDLAVLDMILGEGMDGLDTFIALREHHPDLPAIIASGFAETDRVREAQRLGAAAYIKKPYTLQMLAQAVKTALQRA